MSTDTPIRVGHCYTDDGGVDKYRTLTWKDEFLKHDIPVYNVDEEYGEINVGWVSHPVSRGRYIRGLALRQKGIPIVMGVDDDYNSIHPDNRAYESTRGAWDYLRETAEISEAVVVSTEKLAEHFEPYNENIFVIPNYIPDDQLMPTGALAFKEVGKRFGWAGSLDTHPTDLDVLGFAVRDLVLEDGFEFHHIGQGKLSPILNAPVYEHGPTDKEGYLDKIYNFLDVGYVPLDSSEFNESKSYLKALEYSALGVPWISSPVRDYLRLHRQDKEIGLIASKPSDWKRLTRKLLTDRAFYSAQRRRNLEWAGTQVISKNYQRWIEPFEVALGLDK